MFWKGKKGSDKLRFQHYVPIRLSENLPKIFEKKAKEKNYSEIYKDFIQLLASETFIIACMIGTCRSDIITEIFKQNDENYEQLMEVTRNGLIKIIAVGEQRGEISLNALASSFKKPEMGILPKDDPAKGLSIEVINSLGAPFLFGYTFGHDHPQLFLEMLKKRFEEASKSGPYTFFVVGMLSIYSPLIEEGDRSFLLNTNGLDEIRLAYENGTLPQKLVSIYQNIASELVRNYELTVGLLK
jgi:hypothetical protein